MPPSHVLFFDFFEKKKKKRNMLGCGKVAFWEKKKKKKVKVVELPQFESLGGGEVSHLKLLRQKYRSVDTVGGKV
jgi:hypothetical protein